MDKHGGFENSPLADRNPMQITQTQIRYGRIYVCGDFEPAAALFMDYLAVIEKLQMANIRML